jgi:hypothetical protein
MNETELGVPVAKILDFRLSAVEAVVTLAKLTLPVLPLAVSDTSSRQDQNADLANKIDSMARSIASFRIACDICPRLLLARILTNSDRYIQHTK